MRLLGVGVFLSALVLYTLTLCRIPFPVQSSSYITTHVGIDPFQSYQNSLWSLLLRAVTALPFGAIAVKANLLSVPLAAVSLWLMYYIVSRIRHDRTTEETLSAFSVSRVGMISGVFAACFLAVSPPFWFIATRAHPLSAHTALLLTCVALFLRGYETQGRKPLYLMCFLLGVGMVQFPTMILLAPCFGLGLLYLFWKVGELSAKNMLLLVSITLLGYATLFLVAGVYMMGDSYALREFDGMGALLLQMIKEQYLGLRQSAPKVGWLSVLLFAVVPWFIVVVIPKRTLLRRQSLIGSNLLHAVLFVVGLGILFNTPIAPFYTIELRNILVTPYVFVACWMGYLVGYWHIMWTRTRRHEAQWLTSLRGLVARVNLPILAIVLLAAGWENAKLVSPRHAAPSALAARELVNHLDGRTWLLSNGILDSQIQIFAADAGVDLTLINMQRVHLDSYRRYLASLMEEPRLKSLVEIGLPQLLSEWMRLDPAFYNKLAVLADSDFWYGAGYLPKPARMMFLAEQQDFSLGEGVDLEADRRFFLEMAGLLDGAETAPFPLDRINGWLRIHVSKLANNTGYYLEEHGRPDAAFRSYRVARELSEDNVSALLNLNQLASREQRPEAERYANEVEAFIEKQEKKLQEWSLSYYWGYVRDPQTLFNRGMTWALSGKPSVAIREIERSVGMTGETSSGSMQLLLAALHGEGGDDQDSENLYNAYLSENPDDLRALIGLARLELRRGNFDISRTYLARLEALEVSDGTLAMELAAVELFSGNQEQAGVYLDQALEANPRNIRAVALRLRLAVDQGDDELVATYSEKLERLGEGSVLARLTFAELATGRGEYDVARDNLEEVVERGVGVSTALNKLIELDILEGRMDLGYRHVKSLLQLNPLDARANLILGNILFEKGKLDEAEAAFKASLQEQISSEGLNSLGWAMVVKGDFDEGLRLADQALAQNDGNPGAWDTRGVALLKLKRMDEAEEALIRAVEISKGHPLMLIHLAELYEAVGDQERALDVVNRLNPRLGELPEEVADQVTRMQSRLGQ